MMKKVRGLKVGLVMLAVLSLAAAQNQQSREVSLSVGSAVLADLKGSVTLRAPDGSPVTAQRGLTLPPQSVIETGKGSLLLNLQDGSQVLVKPHSRVLLKSPNENKGYYLELLLGKILAQVQKRFGNAPSFRMGTPTAVITVRGTRFEVEVNKKSKTVVDVYEGVVAVAGFGGEENPVLLYPGFWTEVGTPGALPRAPREILRPTAHLDTPGQGEHDDNNPFGRTSGEHSGSGEREGSSSSSGEVEREGSGTTTTRPPG